MRYQVGNIGVQIHASTSSWTRHIHRAIHRQLDGFQVYAGRDVATPYQINFYDYALLPTNQSDNRIVVPRYCYYSAGIYVDMQQKIAFEINGHILNVWCSTGCRGVSIPFLLQVILLLQGKSFVHAAAIDVHGSGILLPAFGGVGKTSVIACAIKKAGVKALGDDMIIVTNQGMLEPYLRPFALYEYHKPLFPDFFAGNCIEYKPLTLSWRIHNKIRAVLGDKLSRDWHQPEHIVRTGYIPVAPGRVLAKSVLATDPVKLDHVYLLQRSSTCFTVELHSLDSSQAIGFMLNVMYHEWHSQLRFLLSWLTHRSISAAAYLAQVEAILRAAVSNSRSVNLIIIPLDMPPIEVAEEIIRHVIR